MYSSNKTSNHLHQKHRALVASTTERNRGSSSNLSKISKAYENANEKSEIKQGNRGKVEFIDNF